MCACASRHRHAVPMPARCADAGTHASAGELVSWGETLQGLPVHYTVRAKTPALKVLAVPRQKWIDSLPEKVVLGLSQVLSYSVLHASHPSPCKSHRWAVQSGPTADFETEAVRSRAPVHPGTLERYCAAHSVRRMRRCTHALVEHQPRETLRRRHLREWFAPFHHAWPFRRGVFESCQRLPLAFFGRLRTSAHFGATCARRRSFLSSARAGGRQT